MKLYLHVGLCDHLLPVALSYYPATTGHGHCRHTQTFPLVSGGLEGHVVRFNGYECDADFNHLQSHIFCEDSGWGDEEATVVCRDQLYSLYGIGGIYIMAKSVSAVFGTIQEIKNQLCWLQVYYSCYCFCL